MNLDFAVEDPQVMARRVEQAILPDSLYALLCETARQHGHRPALNFIDDAIVRTWSEVLEGVDQAASGYAAMGVMEGTHVAVMAWNREAFILTWLALAKLGAVMVPVNATYTQREIDYALRTSDSQYLVIDDDLLPAYREINEAPLSDACLVVLGAPDRAGVRNWDALLALAEGGGSNAAPADRQRLLNIQYTSGTTGFAKGCMLTHEYWLVLGAAS